jgi:hypothetical protein
VIVCVHCRAEVWWSLPQPSDPCWECGEPIADLPKSTVTDERAEAPEGTEKKGASRRLESTA